MWKVLHLWPNCWSKLHQCYCRYRHPYFHLLRLQAFFIMNSLATIYSNSIDSQQIIRQNVRTKCLPAKFARRKIDCYCKVCSIFCLPMRIFRFRRNKKKTTVMNEDNDSSVKHFEHKASFTFTVKWTLFIRTKCTKGNVLNKRHNIYSQCKFPIRKDVFG